MEMTSRQMLDAIDAALGEVSRRLASGELDHSGRFFTDAELAEQARTGEWGNIAARTPEPSRRDENDPAA
jgi:hypothetical protein